MCKIKTENVEISGVPKEKPKNSDLSYAKKHIMFKKMIKILKGLPRGDFVLRNTKRVSAFTAVDGLKSLTAANFDPALIKECFDFMLDEGIAFKVKIIQNNIVDVNFKRTFSASDLFIWDKEDNTKIYLFLTLLFFMVTGIVGLFKVFPSWYRYFFICFRNVAICIIGFMFVAAVVRLCFYLITLFLCSEQCWIWPNLFADCGVIESFIPLYQWTTPAEKEKEE